MPAYIPTCFTCAYCDRKSISCPVYPKQIPNDILCTEPEDLSHCNDKYHYIYKPMSDHSEPLK